MRPEFVTPVPPTRETMPQDHRVILETARLTVRYATQGDVELFYSLWTNPVVMRYVGFPCGLPVTRRELKQRLSPQAESEFERLLVVELKATGQAIGECKLSNPDEEGIAEPDVKLLPQFWGHKYGVEVWQGLVDYQFTHTDCRLVQATPNVNNTASIKMQETVGGVRTGEGVYQFPESMQGYTAAVRHYIYRVRRADWERARSNRPANLH
jgi:[ribosomal protein S5]-alanine N-acetyltransferase